MPIFKGRDGEVLPSRRNPTGSADEEESIFIKKISLLCPECKEKFREFMKSQNTESPKVCDKCKESMKELSMGTLRAGRV